MLGEDGLTLTSTGEIFGTPLYMSPEQCRGARVDNRTDVYSLGCVLFEALTGQPPFRGNSAMETMSQHLNATTPSLREASLGLDFPPALEQIVQKMLAKDPADRYQRCCDVAADLMLLQQGQGSLVKASKADLKPSEGKKRALSKFWVVCAGVACVALLFLLVYFGATYLAKQNQPQLTQSDANKADSQSAPLEKSILAGDRKVEEETELRKYPQITVDKKSNTVFDFGPKLKLGTLWLRGLDSPIQAQGVKRFAPGSQVTLAIPMIFLQDHPRALSNFATHGLYGLVIKRTGSIPVGSTAFYSADFLGNGKRIDELSDETIATIADLKELGRLEMLDLHLKSSQYADLRLERMEQLRELDLRGLDIDGRELAKSKFLSRLTSLKLGGSRNVDVVLKALDNSKQLTTLFLSSTDLTNDDLRHIGTMSNLEGLVLRDNQQIDETGLSYLINLGRLNYLDLSNTSVTAKAIPTLRKLPKLRQITLSADTPTKERKLWDMAFPHIGFSKQ